MLSLVFQILSLRLDFVATGLVAVGGCFAARRFVRVRSKARQTMPKTTWFLIAAILVLGMAVAEWFGRDQSKRLAVVMAGFGQTFSQALTASGHESVTLDTRPDDPRYLELIELEKGWLKVNPLIADIYTFRVDAQQQLRLFVDSETDYNRDGRFEGARELRTPIGEIYTQAPPSFYSALAGEQRFEATVVTDRWGAWVTSVTPIYDQRGHIDAAVGVDFPAALWLRLIGVTRGVWLTVTLSFGALVLCGSAMVTLMRGEITARHKAMLRVEQARESALEASSAKSEFLAVTSHEVRTPLTAILGFANLLADTPLDPQQRRYLETMNHAGQRLMELLNGILDFTRIESGRLELERLPWSPAVLVHEVIETTSARAQQRGLALHFENRLPTHLSLLGDATRVRQILLNLMGNAVKFTAAGSVTVTADWLPDPVNALTGRMVIEVADTGCGIAAEKLPHLFKAFAQVSSSTTRTHGGSGLGLAICRRLADLMGGQLTVRSTPGKGSRFTLSLQCSALPVREAVDSAAEQPDVAPTCFQGRALVVDDQRLNRELLKVMLQRSGMEVDLAADGPSAIALAAQHRFAIVLADLEMPGMDGFTMVEKIRTAEAPGRRVPIVAISALTAKGTAERCKACGFDEYLTKPVYLPALHSTLAALLPRAVSGGRLDTGCAALREPELAVCRMNTAAERPQCKVVDYPDPDASLTMPADEFGPARSALFAEASRSRELPLVPPADLRARGPSAEIQPAPICP